VIAPLLAVLLSCGAAAESLPGTALPVVDKDTAAWTAYQRIHSDFFDLDKIEDQPPAVVALGRQLFFDPRLSGNGAMSCWNCHDPSRAWGDAQARAVGADGERLERNSPSLLTTHRNIPHPFFWDGREAKMSKAVLESFYDRTQMDATAKSLVETIDGIPGYTEQFHALYGPGGVTPEAVSAAISAFIKADIRPGVTPFDRYATDPDALTPSEKRGMVLYAGKARCLLCHAGAFFSDDFYHNVGLIPTPGLDDPGRYRLVHEKHAYRAFHTPPLREVAKTAPYMHDGSEKTLRDIVEFYNRGGDDRGVHQDDLVKPLDMTESERMDLVAFLAHGLDSPPVEVETPVLPTERRAASAMDAYHRALARLADAAAAARRPELAAAHAASARVALADWRAMHAADCLAPAESAVAALEDAADARRPGLAALAARARRAVEACRPPPEPDEGAAVPSPAGLFAEADREIAKAGRLLDEADAAAPAPDGRPREELKGFEVPAFLSELAAGRWSPTTTDIMIQAVDADVMKYYEYVTFLADDPARCAEVKVHKVYFGIEHTGEWSCRERYFENELDHALITHPPDFERRCRESFGITYERFDAKDAAGACKVIHAHWDAPGPCPALIASGYLAKDKRISCDNFFARIYQLVDPAACEILSGGPTKWHNRCLALSAFTRARAARDPSLCGERGLCRAFMGDRENSVVAMGRRIKAEAEDVLAKNWMYEVRPRTDDALRLAGDATRRLAAVESLRSPGDRELAAEMDRRQEAVARLEARAVRLQRLMPPPKTHTRSATP
jgi:cytochrome c peroxidase